MKNLSILLAFLFLASCAQRTTSTTTATTSSEQSAGANTAFRDGTSVEKAVIAKDIPFEYKWVKEHYPGSKVLSQALLNQKGKAYDMLKIEQANGQKTEVYFDISSFFGKF